MRGAPLIATVGMFSLGVELHNKFYSECEKIEFNSFYEWIVRKCDYLVNINFRGIKLKKACLIKYQFIIFLRYQLVQLQ